MGEPKGYIVVPLADNPDDELRSLEVDANDNLKVAVQSAPTTVVIPHADEKLFGFKQIVVEHETWSADATYGLISFTAVPTGKIHVITNICMYDESSAITNRVQFYVRGNTTSYYIKSEIGSIAANQSVDWQGILYLKAGDILRIYFNGNTAYDLVIADIFGYEMNAP